MVLRNYKKTSLLICFCAILGQLAPTIAHADEINSWGGDSGRIDAGKAAEQRAAQARRAAKKQQREEEKKAAEAKKDSETQKSEMVAK